MIRIDQIWTSRQLTATNVFAAPALPSDHRLVVADFLVE
jgi:endonuclease/exonuclease/phosphatase (EEP) superfamily protein YafD